MFGKVAALKAMDNNNFDAGKHVLKAKKTYYDIYEIMG